MVSAFMSTHTGAKTVVRAVYGNSNGFEVKVGMHRGSALSPLLFVIVMEALSREFRFALPWDDLVVVAETEDDEIKRLNEWQDNMENGGMRVFFIACLVLSFHLLLSWAKLFSSCSPVLHQLTTSSIHSLLQVPSVSCCIVSLRFI